MAKKDRDPAVRCDACKYYRRDSQYGGVCLSGHNCPFPGGLATVLCYESCDRFEAKPAPSGRYPLVALVDGGCVPKAVTEAEGGVTA